MFYHAGRELGREHNDIGSVPPSVIGDGITLARHSLDELPNPRDELLFVRSQGKLHRVVPVESRRTAFGDVVAEQFEEGVCKAQLFPCDLVHGEHQ